MATIASNIQQVHRRIAVACAAAQRPVQSVTLLTVSKTFGPDAVREAVAAGERRFGENYVQEGVDKIASLADLRSQLEWHLIGPLQSNKTRVVAEQFDWVHTVDRLKTALRLSEQRPAALAPLQVCIQVNLGGEDTKSGVAPADAITLAHEVARLPRVTLRGLMSIPPPTDDAAMQRESAAALRELMQALNDNGLTLDTLSIGMSADMDAAIAEGSTMVRIGSAIFGSRPPAA
jgi:pyridoxal phosphate enzyme (YggS family)